MRSGPGSTDLKRAAVLKNNFEGAILSDIRKKIRLLFGVAAVDELAANGEEGFRSRKVRSGHI